MGCTLETLESAQYDDCYEKKDSGLSDLSTIWDPQDIETYPTAWGNAVAGQNTTAFENKLTITGSIAMKTNKKPLKVPCIIDKNSYSAKSKGNSWEPEVKIQIQKTLHNEGFVDGLLGRRFLFGFQENDGPVRILGRTNGVTTGYMAMIKPDSVNIVGGEATGGEKYIEFIVTAKKYLPAVYTGTITY
ncbi:hypothetical protein [Emticicia sp. W12TSBA100-4]|uniref:hypothetical protein n=1 Tax=Emticicia sp. W12TSBA100-4 TaxID=3160965 RepID=UPI003305C44C